MELRAKRTAAVAAALLMGVAWQTAGSVLMRSRQSMNLGIRDSRKSINVEARRPRP
jgi:hypothetical protein